MFYFTQIIKSILVYNIVSNTIFNKFWWVQSAPSRTIGSNSKLSSPLICSNPLKTTRKPSNIFAKTNYSNLTAKLSRLQLSPIGSTNKISIVLIPISSQYKPHTNYIHISTQIKKVLHNGCNKPVLVTTILPKIFHSNTLISTIPTNIMWSFSIFEAKNGRKLLCLIKWQISCGTRICRTMKLIR